MQIELNDEMVSKLVATSLKEYRDGMIKELEKVVETKRGFVYAFDWAIDVQEIQSRIDAINLILEDYTIG
jgi:hypothetical protein